MQFSGAELSLQHVVSDDFEGEDDAPDAGDAGEEDDDLKMGRHG